jgi:hypothetical protein
MDMFEIEFASVVEFPNIRIPRNYGEYWPGEIVDVKKINIGFVKECKGCGAPDQYDKCNYCGRIAVKDE